MTVALTNSASRALGYGTAVAAVSSVFLAVLGGYGTIHRQFVTLYGWSIAQAVSPAENAEPPLVLTMLFAGLLNVLVFLVPALIIWFVCRDKWPKVGRNLIVAWCVLFLATLFFLFPASDGP